MAAVGKLNFARAYAQMNPIIVERIKAGAQSLNPGDVVLIPCTTWRLTTSCVLPLLLEILLVLTKPLLCGISTQLQHLQTNWVRTHPG